MSARIPGAHGAPGKNPDLYNVDDFTDKRADESTDGRFGRLFAIGDGMSDSGEERMPPHPLPRYDLVRLGMKGGPLDPANGPPTGQRNSLAPAGITFLGQFIDHDITLDVNSKFDRPQMNARLENVRTPNLDLDCVYGGGREASPHHYGKAGGSEWEQAKLVEGNLLKDNNRYDLPRMATGRAMIGDPRNDENIFVAQVQAAFIRFHNACVDYLHDHNPGASTEELFEEARDTTTHYYHRIVLEDFLYRVIGLDMLQAIATEGRRYYFPNGFRSAEDWPERPFMPVEFAVAAYRYGHSTVRDEYVVNAGLAKPLFDDDLKGFQPLEAKHMVDWDWFFVGQDQTAEQFAHKIDPFLPIPLFELPFAPDQPSLAARNLMRGRSFRLPAGEEVALRMIEDGVYVGPNEIMTPAHTIEGFEGTLPGGVSALQDTLQSKFASTNTPLWLYILMEAAVFGKGFSSAPFRTAEEQNSTGGDRLGPVGGRIVGEVLMGLLDHYRDATGKGLDYDPKVPSYYVDDNGQVVGDASGVRLTGMKFGPRMAMRGLIDFAYGNTATV